MSLPKAIIVDIDGTLAQRGDRSPFEWLRVGEDKVKRPIRDLVNVYAGMGIRIILMSGRDEVCRNQTMNWLSMNCIDWDSLHMRPEKNMEKDTIIKRRLYDQFVKDQYEVIFVLDDRDSVVEMWRKDLGFTCLQVDYGNF